MSLQKEEYPLKERIDRSNDPYYQGMFWCYEAQQFFRWEEMQDWYDFYEVATEPAVSQDVFASLVGAPL